MRGVGGFDDWRTLDSVGTGGVGIGLFEVAECFVSEADESWRGRFDGRTLVAEDGIPLPSVVGEAV